MPQDELGPACRVAVVAADGSARDRLIARVEAAAGLDLVAWADDVAALLVLGTRVDVCLCAEPPGEDAAARLRQRGAAVVVPRDGDGLTALVRHAVGRAERSGPGARGPQLAPRQREVLVAYVAGNDLLPTVARRLGMERETFKTHLRRIRTKYADAGRPAPTRRDLYVRALEDGLIRPPDDNGGHGPARARGHASVT